MTSTPVSLEALGSPAEPSDEVHRPRTSPHAPFIVTCPACGGSGLVLRDDSQVHLGCKLCWRRGVVARIVAEKYLSK